MKTFAPQIEIYPSNLSQFDIVHFLRICLMHASLSQTNYTIIFTLSSPCIFIYDK
jgi:hypothetical protein